MTTDELLDRIWDRGLVVVCRQGRLELDGRRELVTPALLELLAFHQQALAALFQAEQPEPAPVVLSCSEGPNRWRWAGVLHGLCRECRVSWPVRFLGLGDVCPECSIRGAEPCE